MCSCYKLLRNTASLIEPFNRQVRCFRCCCRRLFLGTVLMQDKAIKVQHNALFLWTWQMFGVFSSSCRSKSFHVTGWKFKKTLIYPQGVIKILPRDPKWKLTVQVQKYWLWSGGNKERSEVRWETVGCQRVSVCHHRRLVLTFIFSKKYSKGWKSGCF